MKNNKWKFFVLNLSFIGWSFLAALPNAIFLTAYGKTDQTFFLSIASLVFLLPVVMLMVYMVTSQTVFYELLTRNLVVSRESDFIEALNGASTGEGLRKTKPETDDDDLEKEEDTYSDEV